jgi:hypothetical protein
LIIRIAIIQISGKIDQSQILVFGFGLREKQSSRENRNDRYYTTTKRMKTTNHKRRQAPQTANEAKPPKTTDGSIVVSRSFNNVLKLIK